MSDTSSTFEKNAQTLKAWGEDVQLALVFLTRIPWPLTFEADSTHMRRSLRTYPLVGFLIGALAATVFVALNFAGVGIWVASFIAVAVLVLITGALHEDGLADVADGFGGGQTIARKLEIMRDSHVGTYGILALIFSIGIRVAALASFDNPLSAGAALIAVCCLSRLGPVLLLWKMVPARSDGVASSLTEIDPAIVVQASAIGVGLFLLVSPLSGALVGLVGAGLILYGFKTLAMRQVGGQTGDVLGASQQLVEITALVCLAAMI